MDPYTPSPSARPAGSMPPEPAGPSQPQQGRRMISDFMPRQTGAGASALAPARPPQPAGPPTLVSGAAGPAMAAIDRAQQPPAGRPNQAFAQAATQPLSQPVQPAAALVTPVATPATVPGAGKPDPDQPARPHVSFEVPEPVVIQPEDHHKPKSAWQDVLSIFGVLASALVLAFLLISFVFQSYQVDGPSMQTTLENNDHLIVWKIPKTFANITRQDYIPNRGDVIIFHEPGLDGSTEDKQLIKRVVGLPGERVVVKDNVVTVYNQQQPNGFQPDKTLPYGSAIVTTPGNVDVTVGEGQVFVCGDNRTNSLDSRVFGPVNSEQIIGKLVLRVLPLNTIKPF